MTAGNLGAEFASELLQALPLAWVMAQAVPARYLWRAGFALICGLMAAIPTNVSYWNWCGFPASYTLAYMTTVNIGFLAAGLVAAKVLGRPRYNMQPRGCM
jgi:hypothetical protein